MSLYNYPTSYTVGSSGQLAKFTLSNVAIVSTILSPYLAGKVSADESVLKEIIDDMAHALGIEPSGEPSAVPASTFTAPDTSSQFSPSTTSTPLPSSSGSPDPLAGDGAVPNSTSTLSPSVFAHFIVGNTYNYSVSNWLADIKLAASKGIDAFALDIGADTWEASQIANAYSAASKYNANTSNSTAPFRLFLSLDMSSLPCASATNIAPIQSYIKTYANNTNTFRYNGSMLLSTFAGEGCSFGANSLNQGWTNAVKPINGTLPQVYFIPSFFVDPKTLQNLSVIDGAFHWNSAWPMGNYNLTLAPDASYISNLQNKTYMASASPWFFTHYGKNSYNKNWIYRGDDWLFAQRWEMLIQNRTAVPLTEVLTWNDFGESHYLGPIEGIQPMSQSWVNGFDHQGWLDLMKYYIAAYKTGTYPAITKDRVFLWARLYPAKATTSDPVGIPANWQWTQDYLWAVTLLTSPANVTLSCGTSSVKTLVPAGLSKLKLPLSLSCSVKATVVRNTTTALSFSPAGFSYNTKPKAYNFNAFVASSAA